MQSNIDSKNYDVVILGGGLAGLTLAIQLKNKFADINLLVIERREHPVPLATHKVGESSVEIGAHYFEHVLGLKQHLMDKQIKKFGFRFFFNDGAPDITQVTELGASMVLPTPSYQLDRGAFENNLAEVAQQKGVTFIDGAMVRKFELGEPDQLHSISFDCKTTTQSTSTTQTVSGKWLIDASGRAGMIKRKLDLAEPNEHNANAVWFRIADRIDINDWTNDQQWINRCTPPERWRSTSHLCGDGYWVWLIPLSNGSHSVGIVCDALTHPIDTMNTFEKSMTWLKKHQPQLFAVLDSRRDKLQDFAFFKRFSYGCKQVFSGKNRWALTGEAGLFLDPFYSPGSDFIAIANTYITDMIAIDRQSQSNARSSVALEMHASIYEEVYFQLYQNMLTLYQGQYKLFGDPEVMPVKVIWDYTYYWGVMCQLFMQNKLTDIATMGRMQSMLANVQTLNTAMQLFLRAWGNVSAKRNPAQMLDQASLKWFAELNRGLRDEVSDEEFTARIKANLAQLNSLAIEIVEAAKFDYPALDASDLNALLVDCERNVLAETMLFAKPKFAKAA